MEESRRWQGVLGAGALVAVGYRFIPPGDWADVLFTTFGLAILAVGAVRLRGGALTVRRAWGLLCLGLACFALRPAMSLLPDDGEVPRAVMVLLGYLLIPVGSVAFLRARSAGRDRDGLLDGLIVCCALALLLWETIAGPRLSAMSGAERIMLASFPMITALTLALAVRFLFYGGHRQVPVVLLFGSAAVPAGSSIAMVVAGRSVSGADPGWIDTGWLLGYSLVAAAMWHPHARLVTSPAATSQSHLPYGRLLLLGGAMLAVPLVRVTAGVTGPDLVPVGAGVLITLAVLWRVVRLVRERETAREHALQQTQQQAVIVALGHRALSGIEPGVLLEETGRTLAATLSVEHVTVRLVEPCGPDVDDEGSVLHELPLGAAWQGRQTLRITTGEHRVLTGTERTFVAGVANVLAGAVARRRAEDVVRHQATHDALTGLANRALLTERISTVLSRAAATGREAGLLFIDLDGFKSVNDTFGHRAGDLLLTQVARRLERCVRGQDTVARIAGDEFVLLCERLDHRTAYQIADRVVVAMGEPFRVDGELVSVSASVGVAFSRDVAGGDELLRAADDAMYRAKTSGKSRFEVAR